VNGGAIIIRACLTFSEKNCKLLAHRALGESEFDISDQLISLSDDHLMEIVEFADDAMIETRRKVLSQVM
jgi:hypothetical protein